MSIKDILNIKVHSSKLIGDKDALILLSRLNILLAHGFTLLEAFTFINMHVKYKSKEVDSEIIHRIKNGSSCYEILNYLKFPQTIVTQILFAEKFGKLSENLADSYNFLRRKSDAKKRLIKTLQYPLILILVFMTMLFGINHFILPEFQEIYQTMDIKLSPLLSFLNNTIQHFPHFLFILFLFIVSISISSYFYYKKLTMKEKISFVLKLPIINAYYKLFKSYQVTNELALFYQNGIVLQQISKIYTEQNIDLFLSYLGTTTINSIENGLRLPEIFKQIGCFQDDLINFIEQGEKSGRVCVELMIYSDILLSQIEDKMNSQIKIIQPVIFLLLGFLIISLYLVIMLPMFDMLQSIK